MNLELYPSLLAANPLKIGNCIQSCVKSNLSTLHIDIMDMHYVPNLGLNIQLCKQINKEFPEVLLNVHLMTLAPEKIIEQLFKLSIHAIAFHPMTTVDTAKLIKEIQSNGILAGIAINPFEDLLPFERYLCDYFLVMGVSPGFSGQKFNSTTFDKINELKSNSYTDQKGIIVDGGVNLDNINELMRLGVQGCVLGNAIFNGNNIENNIQQIQKNLGSVK